MHICAEREEKLKKVLTNVNGCDIILKLSREILIILRKQKVFLKNANYLLTSTVLCDIIIESLKRVIVCEKVFEKTFKKPLDKAEEI